MTAKPIAFVPATDGQKKQVRRLVNEVGEEVVRELGLDKERAQRLIGTNRHEIKLALIACLQGFVHTDEFADEEAESSYGYLSGYANARPATEQFAAINRLFPRAESYDKALAAKDAPAGTEGNFLILPWWTIAPTYNEAVEIIFGKLNEVRSGRFYNYRQGELGSDRLRESQKKADAMKAIVAGQQGHDVLVVPAQLGLRHRGRSVRRARVVMNGNEFGLGAYEMGFILLTHPNRLEQYDDLYADCAGDEYRFGDSSEFLLAPCFCFFDGRLKFDTHDVGRPRGFYGAASAFLPSE